MARAKKKEKELTIEEKLERALVPVKEQPYQIPENWCWVKFESLIEDIADGPFGSNLKTEHYTLEKEARIIQLSNIGEEGWRDDNKKYTTFKHAMEIERSIVKPGSIVIAKMMPAGRAIICPNNEKMYILSSDAVRVVLHSFLNVKYCVYAINSSFFRTQVQENTQGITRARTSIKKLKNCFFVLPPLLEQQRIVNRIERLFVKLDEAKQKAQVVVDGFEDRKAAILHKAYTGELTEKWRKDNHIDKNTWVKRRIDQISFPRAGFAFDSKKFTNYGYQIIRMGNLYGGILDTSRNPVYISSKEVDEKILKRSLINDGDILITLTGTKYKRDYGYAVCIRGQEKLLVNQRILCLSPYDMIITNYFLYYLQSDFFRNVFFSNETGGVNQGNVSSKFVESIEVPLPTKNEQQEIVNKLDRIIEREESAYNLSSLVLEKIDNMKKSIMYRAFCGELGTNNVDDESAIELLEKVL